MDDKNHSLFFVEQVESTTAIFSEEERHHALSVLRKDSSGVIQATDGKGKIYDCLLRDGTAQAEVTDVREIPAPAPKMHVYIGLPERDAFEEAATNLAALGIASITPVVCLHCQQKWWLTWEKHRLRCEKKMIAGIKQSIGAWLPELWPPLDFDKALESAGSLSDANRFVADAGGRSLASLVASAPSAAQAVCFIGPPGGFSQAEKDALKVSGFVSVKIANTRLRTELAAIVLCAQLLSNNIAI
jgi:16S rRNA (uracil1498-N3)-methyltransferase